MSRSPQQTARKTAGKAPGKAAGKTAGKTAAKAPGKSPGTANGAPAKAAARKAPAGQAVASDWASGVVFSSKEPKLAVSLRLDADILRFFRGIGSGYQTRINEVLRVFMEAHQPMGGDRGDKPTRRAKR